MEENSRMFQPTGDHGIPGIRQAGSGTGFSNQYINIIVRGVIG
jgi:hypothetical protein